LKGKEISEVVSIIKKSIDLFGREEFRSTDFGRLFSASRGLTVISFLNGEGFLRV